MRGGVSDFEGFVINVLSHHVKTTLFCLSIVVAHIWLISCAKLAPTQPPENIDTTSHSIVWQTVTFGIGFSTIWDVSIIDDNNVWAAGEFYLNDSTGNPDPTLYNVVTWDGVKWTPQRLYFTYQGTQFIRPGVAVCAFGPDDVWLAASTPRHWDGHTLNNIDLGTVDIGQVTRFWGRSSSDFYTVGSNGKFSHFNGTSFQSIATGVQSPLVDLYGNETTIYVGSEYYGFGIRPSGIFEYDNSGFRFLFPDASDSSNIQALRDANGVWLSPLGGLWAVGEPFVFRPLISHTPITGINPDRYQLLCIRGQSDSDVWVGGVGGTVLHFNGATWKQYDELKAISGGIEYHTVAVKGNLVVLGGIRYNPDQAILTIGKRNIQR